MAYLVEVWKCGDIIEVEKCHSYRYGRKFCRRSPNHTETSLKQRDNNDRQAIKKLRRQLKANFTEDDLWVSLNFKRSMRMSAQELKDKKVVQNFLRRMKKYYRRAGKEMKYIYVVEYRKRSIHVHMVLTGIEPKYIGREWKTYGYGSYYTTSLYENKDYDGLAEYIVKESKKNLADGTAVTKRRWVPSTNLITPEPKKMVVPYSQWRKEIKPLKGYFVVKASIQEGIHEETGYGFQRYTMQRIPGYGKKNKKKRQKPRKKETNVTKKPKNGKHGNGIRAGD